MSKKHFAVVYTADGRHIELSDDSDITEDELSKLKEALDGGETRVEKLRELVDE